MAYRGTPLTVAYKGTLRVAYRGTPLTVAYKGTPDGDIQGNTSDGGIQGTLTMAYRGHH